MNSGGTHKSCTSQPLSFFFSYTLFFLGPHSCLNRSLFRPDQNLPLTSQPPPLNLAQRFAPTQKRHQSHHARNRQSLEQIPAIVIQEEDPLHRYDRPEEERVCDWSRGSCFREVGDVGAEVCPLFKPKLTHIP